MNINKKDAQNVISFIAYNTLGATTTEPTNIRGMRNLLAKVPMFLHKLSAMIRRGGGTSLN